MEETLAAKRRQSAAHGASRGWESEARQAPEGRKKDHSPTKANIKPTHCAV